MLVIVHERFLAIPPGVVYCTGLIDVEETAERTVCVSLTQCFPHLFFVLRILYLSVATLLRLRIAQQQQ